MRAPETPEALHRALIDWVVANGHPMGVFGPAGTIHTDEARTGIAERGIKYDESTIGDLGGQEWSDNTYDEAHPHPGMWADVVGKHQCDDARWFVPGAQHTLSDVILDILTATD